MAVNVSMEIIRSFCVGADFERAFTLLANVPESASHFPKVAALTDLGDNCYRWEMEKIGIDKHSMQIVYACCYKALPDDGQIIWTPVKGEGNSQLHGNWTITEDSKGVKCNLKISAMVSLPLPGLLKLAIAPLVKREFNGKVDVYIKNLQTALE